MTDHKDEEYGGPDAKEDAAYRCSSCGDEYRDSLSIELLKERLDEQNSAHMRFFSFSVS